MNIVNSFHIMVRTSDLNALHFLISVSVPSKFLLEQACEKKNPNPVRKLYVLNWDSSYAFMEDQKPEF